jgi:FixJ family two-component response regulator
LTNAPLIAIVDDDASFRTAIEELISALGWPTRAFPSAEAFLQSADLQSTQCLILDVQMPLMGGFELQERLALLGSDIPIIFVTAYPDEALRARALEAGAIDLLYKATNLNKEFVNCLHTALNKHAGPPRGS